jgi:monothiol glutaredoxin
VKGKVDMTDRKIQDEIAQLIQNHPIILFMKGNATSPMCGFSGVVCQILNKLNVPFEGINVMQDPDMRQGIKDFTNWPTLPQLYIKGEFIGGADIVREMYQSGELQKLLTDKGLIAA